MLYDDQEDASLLCTELDNAIEEMTRLCDAMEQCHSDAVAIALFIIMISLHRIAQSRCQHQHTTAISLRSHRTFVRDCAYVAQVHTVIRCSKE